MGREKWGEKSVEREKWSGGKWDEKSAEREKWTTNMGKSGGEKMEVGREKWR